MVDIFDPYVLNRVVDERVDDTQFLVNTFFPEVATSEEETIMFDVTNERKLITPFVSPLIEGKLVADQGYATKSFRPAYAKDKRVFDPNKAFRRMAGERIGGSMTPAQRHQAKIAFALDEQITMLNRRLEVMAGDVLVNGTATISGERYPTAVIDYGRRAGNRKVLTSTARWGESGVSPYDNVEAWAQEVTDNTGNVPTDVVMTVDAWNLYRADPKIEKLLDTNRRELADANIATGYVPQPRAGVVYRGRVGYLRFWTYTNSYTDPEDMQTKPVLPAYTVLIGSRDVDGVRHFGAIRDEDAGLQARQYFVKSWVEPDPSRRFLLMQSAPLLVPYRPNNLLSATVR
jgi:hypothetical protein